jgi:hypothetical protein
VYFIVEPNRERGACAPGRYRRAALRGHRRLPARVGARGVRAQPRAASTGQGRVGRRRHRSGRDMTAPPMRMASISAHRSSGERWLR